jgi:multidrug efflux pump subunit AcrA (membrane-fusion protein)
MKFPISFLLIAMALISGCGNKEKTITPTIKPITESVYASATIQAAEQYTLYPAIAGKILSFDVNEGDLIEAGGLIAHMENTAATNTASNAESAVVLSKQSAIQVQELEAQLKSAKEQSKLDSVNFQRQQNLYSKEIGSLSQLESRRLASIASKNSVIALNAKLIQVKNQLRFNQNQAQANANVATKNLGDYAVRSDIGGEVFQLLAKKGEWISPQKPLAIIGNSKDYLVVMEVDEMDIVKIKLGQTVLISMDAYDQSFEGHVSRITPIMNPKTQSFVVEAVFNTRPETLYPGLSAEVNIVIAQKSKALLIPIGSLEKNNIVKTPDGEVSVKTGLKNLEFVEILEGLNEKSQILIPTGK